MFHIFRTTPQRNFTGYEVAPYVVALLCCFGSTTIGSDDELAVVVATVSHRRSPRRRKNMGKTKTPQHGALNTGRTKLH